jgi:hypothetical protein
MAWRIALLLLVQSAALLSLLALALWVLLA